MAHPEIGSVWFARGLAAAGPDWGMVAGLGFVIALAGLFMYGIWLAIRDSRSKAKFEAESRRLALQNQAQEVQAGGAVQQINDLHRRKLELELQLMQAELDSRRQNEKRQSEGDQFNRAALEKITLEIQSLKLHIREQRKRLDEFSIDDD